MQALMLAIVVVIAGAAALVIGPSVAGAQNRGKARLIGIGLMLGGAGLAAVNAVVIVDASKVFRRAAPSSRSRLRLVSR